MPEVTLEEVPQNVKNLFNKGFAALERGTLDYAIDLLFSCVELEPRFLQARKFLRAAELRKFKQKRNNALTHAVSMVTNFPTYLRAMALMKSKKVTQAVVLSERLLRKDPLNPKFIKVFAQATANANLPEAAIQTLEVARDHYPEDIPIINWLGALYLKVGRTRSARECFERLCEICPHDPDAMKSLKDAMALDSMATDGWTEAAEEGGSYRDMMKDSKEAVLLEQESKAVKSEQDAEALIDEYKGKIESDPANVNYYRALARVYAQQAMFDDAVAVVEKAMELSPGDAELESYMSSVRTQRLDHEVAEFAAAGDTAAAQAKTQERDQFVADDLQERVRRYPNDLKLRFEWGVILFKNSYLNEAIQQFQLAQRNAKHRARSLYYLGACFRQKKQYDMALEQLERAVSEIETMDDTKKDIIYELGEIAESMGDRERASGYYKQIYQVDIGYRDIAQKVEQVYGER